MNKFNGVFDSKNVLIPGVVNEVDHRRQRGALAGTGGPVTTTSPRGTLEIFLNTSPIPNSSIVSTFEGMVRNTAAGPRFCINALTRNLAKFGTSKEKSVSINSS